MPVCKRLISARLISRDVLDVKTIAIRQRSLDWSYIEAQLLPLAEAKDQPEIMKALSGLKQE